MPDRKDDLRDLYRLLRERESRGSARSQAAIARAANVSSSYLSEILSGKKSPSPAVAAAIARAYGANDAEQSRASSYARTAERVPAERPGVGVEDRWHLEPWLPPAGLGNTDDVTLSRLLVAENSVVPFTGRADVLADLHRWRDDADPRTGAVLLFGPGGEGKTRLCIELMNESRRAHWLTVVARHASAPSAGRRALPARTPKNAAGVLVFVDYADRWPLADLVTLFDDPALSRELPVRVLLVARSVRWWRVLATRLTRADVTVHEIELGPIARGESEHQQHFKTARDKFAALLGVEDAETIELSAVSRVGHVLDIQMAALVAVDCRRRGVEPPADPVGISSYLLDRERDHWQFMHDKAQQALPTPPEVMARVVCTALLAGPLTYDEGVRALERVGLAQPVQQALDDHTVCYPPSLDSAVLEPLYPDRLAEDFLALQSPGSGVDGWPADPWTAKAAWHFVTPDVENTMVLFPVGSMRAIIILVDTAHRWPHVGESQLFPLLREHPWLARLAGNRALLGLAELPGIDIATLQAIEAIVPLSQHDAWADLGIAAVAQRLAELRLAAATAPEDVADVYTKVFQPLHHAGLRAEALAANAKALEIYERLANESANFLPHLAGTLNNRAMLLHSSGNTDEALQLAEAAVAITSDFAGRGTAGYEHPTALGTLSAVLSAVGRVGDAIEAAAAATQAWQEMTSRHATPGLALARFGHASLLLRAKRHEEALVAADDAIARLRELTYGDPTAYAPDLARAIKVRAEALAAEGRTEEAAAAASESAELYQQLADTNVGRFGVAAIESRFLTVQIFAASRRFEQAAAACYETVTLLVEYQSAGYELNWREVTVGLGIVADDGREHWRTVLAAALDNLSQMLEELGQADEAVATLKAAVAHQRMTWSGADTRAGRRLGDLLLGMAGLTQRLDRHAASLAAAAEAIDVERRLADAGGRPGGRDLGFALINYAIALVALARLSEGVTAGKEACDAFRAADQADDRYAGDLAMSLRMLAGWAKDAGDTRTALDASDQALQLRMPSTGERINPTQADALVEEALRFSWLRTKLHQEPERALDIASMAVHLLQQFQEAGVDKTEDLWHAMHIIADALDELGRPEEAAGIRPRHRPPE